MKQHVILDSHLHKMLRDAAELGAIRAMQGLGVTPPTISWSEACRIYGQGAMLIWKKSGLLTPIQQGRGATKKYDVSELTALALSENRSYYLNAEERRQK